MKFNWTAGLLVVLATSEAVGASNWFSRSGMEESFQPPDYTAALTKHVVYNTWHETELERWLSDHGMPQLLFAGIPACR